MGSWRLYRVWDRSSDKARASYAEKEFITIPELMVITERVKKKKEVWLGKGFHWTDIEASRMHSLMNGGVAKQFGSGYAKMEATGCTVGKRRRHRRGPQFLGGAILIVGSTGVGKPVFLTCWIAQAIMRGEPVIIIDPKGDHGLADNARRV